ncbi:uncharacterized protein Tco025E_01700 [Trypanosoma conorhini]|uniref:Uncharacterized protein n=1 Tax=Trypanosoma conorhini TaxID=83891 RepID=A0A422Q7Y1_9TRYP|nr:uncharacterized protein Tco025E_01700 [Trypanosoma conorhini]RNF26071.1 hypothetical protein Tco025E_01700 [Trypanosoma conorhini]
METVPEDDLLVRQREKLLANAAWIRRQQRRMHGTEGGGEDAADAEYNTSDDEVMSGEGAGATPHARYSAGAELTSASAARQPSVGNAARPTADRQVSGVRPGGPGTVRSSGRRGDAYTTVRGGSALRVQERSALWQLRRGQKLEEQRVLHAEDYSQCTFSPAIHGRPGNLSGPAVLAAPGVEQFLQRQARARELARLKEERGRVDGSRWVHRLTVAEPFLLGQRPAVESLRPPIENVPGTTRELLLEGEMELLSGGVRTVPSDPRGSLLSTTPSSFAALAAAAGVSLPPPGAFSSWTTLYCGGEQPKEDNSETRSTASQ